MGRDHFTTMTHMGAAEDEEVEEEVHIAQDAAGEVEGTDAGERPLHRLGDRGDKLLDGLHVD